MIYRCSNCDSTLEFDPVSGMMQCLRCGSFFETSDLVYDISLWKQTLYNSCEWTKR